MTKHFDTRAAAEAHLRANGWQEVKPGWWMSRNEMFRAAIHPKTGSDVVLVAFIEAGR